MNKISILLIFLISIISLESNNYVLKLTSENIYDVNELKTPSETTQESLELSSYVSATSFNSVRTNAFVSQFLNHDYIASGGTGFLSYDGGGFTFEYDIAKIITKYKVQAVGDVEGYATNVSDWRLEASIDNSVWEVLHTVSGQTMWTNHEIREFNVSNTNSFKYYKLVLVEGGTYFNGIGFSDFQAYGY
jgi:hypothetical protein